MKPVIASRRGPSGAGGDRLAARLVGAEQARGHRCEDQDRLQALAEHDHRGVEDHGGVALMPVDLGRIGGAGVGGGHEVDEAGEDGEAAGPPEESGTHG